MPARDRARRLEMLARWKAAARDPVDEHFNPRLTVAFTKTHVIGGAFITERRRDRPMHRESVARERQAKLRESWRPFMGGTATSSYSVNTPFTFIVTSHNLFNLTKSVFLVLVATAK